MRTRAWLLLSGVAHGALALLLSFVDAPAPGRVLAPPSAPISFEVAASEPVTEPEVPIEPVVEVASVPAVVRQSPRKPRPSAPVTSAPDQLRASRPSAPQASDTHSIELSPRAAALSMMELDRATATDAGPARPGPLRGDAQRTLEDALMSAVRRVDTKNEPVLRPKPGGGFLYAGNGFEASIESDGSVRMEDKFVHAKWHFKPTMGADGELAGFRIFELKYDIFGWLDRKMGNDPFRSERRWFMDHTRGLREQLIEHFHDKRVHSLEGSQDGTAQ